MEIERNNTILFVNTSVSRDADDLLTTTVYRKPTHIDQYLAHGSHHPLWVKRGIVKCLYNHVNHLIMKPSTNVEEKKHLPSVLVSNGYPYSSVQKLTKQLTKNPRRNLNQLQFYPLLNPFWNHWLSLQCDWFSTRCDLFTNRTIFCSKPNLFLSQWEWSSKTKQPSRF